MRFSDAISVDLLSQTLLATEDQSADVPEEVLLFLARLRLLVDVPFNTLVPDEELLPVESIRFFHLDRAWTDALVQGALSVATGNSIERAQLEQIYSDLEKKIDTKERIVRVPGGEAPQRGKAGAITGFLMRSAAVAGWPGMHVRAYRSVPSADETEVIPETHRDRIKLLRLERLAPSVLLALFDGQPKVVHIEEPRQGVQFGVRLETLRNNRIRAKVPARNVESAQYVKQGGGQTTDPREAREVTVKFRPGSPGVLDLAATGRAFLNLSGTQMSGSPADISGAEFALQMLRFPVRQIFSDDASDAQTQSDAFKPNVAGLMAEYSEQLKVKVEEG